MSDTPTPGYLQLSDGSTFPRPAMDGDEYHSPANAITWQGGASLSRPQELWLASCADAFAYLIANPTIARKKIPLIREALMRPTP